MTQANYAISKQMKGAAFDDAVAAVTERLKGEGFGVLTEIDVQKTFKAKLDVDFRRYLILGACNPKLAHQALTAEPLVGVLLPCNVIVAEDDDGVSVSAINPRAMFSVVENNGMGPIVEAVDEKLRRVIDGL